VIAIFLLGYLQIKEVLTTIPLVPRSNFLVEWENIASFRSGDIRVGKHSQRTQLVLSISRVKGYKLRFGEEETLSLASYLRGCLFEKEKPFVGEWA
jgi:hypothetical protein